MRIVKFNYIIPVFILAVSIASCKKDNYKNDGGVHNAKVNMSTYDYLKSKPIFDSLVKAIDMAGLKDLVNSDITFFASTNWSVRDYMLAKKQLKIIATGDENISFSMSDLDADVLRDSLKMYMFKGKLTRENLTVEGNYYESLLGPLAPGERLYIKLRRTRDYNEYVDFVDYINYTKVIGTLDAEEPSSSSIPENQRDKTQDCQTTGIITTTGILHVLGNQHRLFFNGEDLP